MFSPQIGNLGKVALTSGFIILAAVILALSLTKAGWEVAYGTKMGDSLREVSVLTETKEFGDIRRSCYKFPETRILPGFLLYEVKLARDYLWWYYAPHDLAKVKTANLIADKRMMEAVRLEQEDPDNRIIWDTSQKAVEWLIRAQDHLTKVEEKEGEKEFLETKMEEAKLTYRNILNSFSKSCPDGVQYQELTEKLNNSNEKYPPPYEESAGLAPI